MDFYQFNVLLHELSDQVYDGDLDKNVAAQQHIEAAAALPDDASREMGDRWAREVAKIDPPPAARTTAVREAEKVVQTFRRQGTKHADEAEFERICRGVAVIADAAPESERYGVRQTVASLGHYLDRLWAHIDNDVPSARGVIMDFGTFNLRLHELSDRVYDGELDKHEVSRRLLEYAEQHLPAAGAAAALAGPMMAERMGAIEHGMV